MIFAILNNSSTNNIETLKTKLQKLSTIRRVQILSALALKNSEKLKNDDELYKLYEDLEKLTEEEGKYLMEKLYYKEQQENTSSTS